MEERKQNQEPAQPNSTRIDNKVVINMHVIMQIVDSVNKKNQAGMTIGAVPAGHGQKRNLQSLFCN